jgi:hypothetical protein
MAASIQPLWGFNIPIRLSAIPTASSEPPAFPQSGCVAVPAFGKGFAFLVQLLVLVKTSGSGTTSGTGKTSGSDSLSFSIIIAPETQKVKSQAANQIPIYRGN